VAHSIQTRTDADATAVNEEAIAWTGHTAALLNEDRPFVNTIVIVANFEAEKPPPDDMNATSYG